MLLIEQQGWNGDTYTPVEIDPAVFDAIATAVAQGIVVIGRGQGPATPRRPDLGGMVRPGGATAVQSWWGAAPRASVSYRPILVPLRQLLR